VDCWVKLHGIPESSWIPRSWSSPRSTQCGFGSSQRLFASTATNSARLQSVLGCPSVEADPWPHVPTVQWYLLTTFSFLPRADRYGCHPVRSTTPSVEWEHLLRIESIFCVVGALGCGESRCANGVGKAVLPSSHFTEVRVSYQRELHLRDRQPPSDRLRGRASEQRILLDHTLLYAATS
jgi:hypothetical protein